MSLGKEELLQFLRSHPNVVQASVSPMAGSQSAVVSVAVTDDFQLIFDTLSSTRKAHNLAHNPKISFVFGGWTPGDERTAQFEGIADQPSGAELERLKAIYYARFPDGPERLSWPGLTYFRVRPTWIRYSDFNQSPPAVIEFDSGALGLAAEAPSSFRQAYEAADYRVQDYPHDFVIKIGQPCKAVDNLCWDYSVDSAIFITAYNPGSEKTADLANQEAQARLRERLVAMHAAAVLQGAGVDPQGLWQPEASFLAMGLSLEQGRQLAGEFGQLGFVWLQAGKPAALVMAGEF